VVSIFLRDYWRLLAVLVMLMKGADLQLLVLALVSIFPRDTLETACNTIYLSQGR
jgi:hypothetical protein